MKALQIKFPVILLIISLITILGLSNCGQQKNAKNTDTNTEPAKQAVEIPAVTADSQASVPANQGNTQQEVKADLKKEILPTDKKKEPELVKKSPDEQPVVTDKKPAPNTNVTPSDNKTVIQPQPTPVVKVPEPIKPTPEPQPKTVEVPKPVLIVTPEPEQGRWTVPAKYKTMTSSFAVDKESIELGKSLYSTHCKSCHGSKGDGNGTKAASLDTKIGSFLSVGFLAQKPGEVYYKTITGRKDMPKFEKKIPDEEERWAIVHYIMNFKN